MAASKAVRRLLGVLELEEEHRRRELNSAQGELTHLELSLHSAVEREKQGRRLIMSSAKYEDSEDRLVGWIELQAGKRRGVMLQKSIESSSHAVDYLRAAFLEKRVERRQAESLVEAAEAREAVEVNRRAQQTLDDWFLTRTAEEKTGK